MVLRYFNNGIYHGNFLHVKLFTTTQWYLFVRVSSAHSKIGILCMVFKGIINGNNNLNVHTLIKRCN